MGAKRRKDGITDEMIVEKYKSGIRVREIAEWVGVSDRYIRNILYKSGIEKLKQPRKYKVNEDFFKTWSHDMAYVLGLVLTDGSVFDNKLVTTGSYFYISQADAEFLVRVREVLNSDHPIVKDAGKSKVYRLSIGSFEMVTDLIKLGIGANKSLVIRIPDVPDEFMGSFMRGVIDGDGSIHRKGYTMTLTSGSKLFADDMLDLFVNRGFRSRITTQELVSGKLIYRIIVSGRNDVIKLADWLYEFDGVHVSNKRKLFYQKEDLLV